MAVNEQTQIRVQPGILKLKAQLYHLPVFSRLEQHLAPGRKVGLHNIAGSFLAFVVEFSLEATGLSHLVVLPETEAAEKLVDDLHALLPEWKVAYFPAVESVPFDRGIFTPALHSMRLHALNVLLHQPASVIVTTATALLKRLPSPLALMDRVKELRVGQAYDRDALVDWLVEQGYERVDTVEELGQFSARGSIVDVFSFDADVPVRVEFDIDTIASMREFDVLSQLSTNRIGETTLVGQVSEEDNEATLLDYFAEGGVIFWENPTLCRKLMNDWLEEAELKVQNAGSDARHPAVKEVYAKPDSLFDPPKAFIQLNHHHLERPAADDIEFHCRPASVFQGNVKLFADYLRRRLGTQPSGSLPGTLILCDSAASRQQMEEILEAELGEVPPGLVLEGSLHHGFHLKEPDLEVLTDHEIFQRLRMHRRRRKIRMSGSLIRNLQSLKMGDFVVHVDYGIGQFMGTERIKVAGTERECLKLRYADDNILYVNLDKLNRIQKFVGEEGYQPRLTHLGSAEWERVKKRTRRAVERVARELVQLYAARLSQQGFAFSPDTIWQKELEAAFPYQDTPDQQKATEDVKKDMESPRPMDRLVCGDVGYGKTEIAVRAAFKAVMDGKQVAVLVPTTILAQQHYRTFKERMANFPVVVEVISRFRTPKEQKEILQRLAEGKVDILIGTHRLLSRDVQFHDLGLLIVDEEQRFGVKQKERLRALKVTVDTLTLAATPIPRTLHMSLMGARDLSNVDTPPANRLPIHTEITTWDDHLIYRAITREMERGGQVFFVHNRVQTIAAVAELLKRLVPSARIAVAHGQMKERELEKIMADFTNQQYDVLVATMIIENGLDIPNCNTIIVNRADQFGLAQLYQLRGRVGRADRQAFAYLIIPPQERLNETALKRLYAIEEFADLGSGMKIAMRDMEIRGTGNLLGHQQSGFINTVGYDLYQKILRDTVEAIQQETLPEEYLKQRMPEVDAAVDVDGDLYIPDDYIPSPSEKVAIYHRLLHLDNLSLIDGLVREMQDRFGPLPEQVSKLIEMVKIKKLASRLYVKHVKIVKDRMWLTFEPRAVEKEQFVELVLPRFINQAMTRLKFDQARGFKVTVHLKGNTELDRLSFAKNFLQAL